DRHPAAGREDPRRPSGVRRSVRQPDRRRLEVEDAHRRAHPRLRRLDRPATDHRRRSLPTRPPWPVARALLPRAARQSPRAQYPTPNQRPTPKVESSRQLSVWELDVGSFWELEVGRWELTDV